MNTWLAGKDLIKKLMPEKEDFYNNLNTGDITDYKHAKNVWKDFESKNHAEYHDLYV